MFEEKNKKEKNQQRIMMKSCGSGEKRPFSENTDVQFTSQ